MLASPFLAW